MNGRPYTDEERQYIRAEIAAGTTYRDIANAVGRTVNAIRLYAHKNHIGHGWVNSRVGLAKTQTPEVRWRAEQTRAELIRRSRIRIKYGLEPLISYVKYDDENTARINKRIRNREWQHKKRLLMKQAATANTLTSQ